MSAQPPRQEQGVVEEKGLLPPKRSATHHLIGPIEMRIEEGFAAFSAGLLGIDTEAGADRIVLVHGARTLHVHGHRERLAFNRADMDRLTSAVSAGLIGLDDNLLIIAPGGFHGRHQTLTRFLPVSSCCMRARFSVRRWETFFCSCRSCFSQCFNT